MLSVFRSPAEGSRWVQTVAQRLVSLGKPACFTAADLRQLHQFFVWCSEAWCGGDQRHAVFKRNMSLGVRGRATWGCR